MLVKLPPPEQLRLQRIAEHLHRLGPRAIAEALAQVADDGDLDRLEAYRRLPLEAVAAVGGDQFPPRPLMAVPS